MQYSLSETEISSKVEYDFSRLDTKLWNMLEKDRKKNSKAKLLKKSKGIDEVNFWRIYIKNNNFFEEKYIKQIL